MSAKWYRDWFGFGQRIKKTRLKLGISREALAERIEISEKNLGRIETGVQATTIETLYRISSILNVSCDYLLFNKEQILCEECQSYMDAQKTAINAILENCSPKQLKCIGNLMRDVLLFNNEVQARYMMQEDDLPI